MPENTRLTAFFLCGMTFVSIAFFPLCRFITFAGTGDCLTEPDWMAWGVSLFVWSLIFAATLLSIQKMPRLFVSFSLLLFSGLFALTIKLYSDMGLLYGLMRASVLSPASFSSQLSLYIVQEGRFFLVNFGLLLIVLLIRAIKPLDVSESLSMRRLLMFSGASCVMLFPLMLSLLLPVLNTVLLWQFPTLIWEPLPPVFMLVINSVSVLLMLGFIGWAYSVRIPLAIERFAWLKWFQMASIALGAMVMVNIMSLLWVVMRWHQISSENAQQGFRLMIQHDQVILLPLLPVLIAFMVVSLITARLKKKLFDETDKAEETSGYFGSAVFLKPKEYTTHGLYEEKNQVMIGADEQKRLLYLPLKNKLTIAPPGVGKTSSSSIPALLSYDGPVFVFDVKGEMWAVTARYRHEVLKREVVVIDPFGVTKGHDFQKGKPAALKKEYRFNPFDWLPEERRDRDRVLNNFAASFIVNEGGSIKHFDDNAKILIRGYIDFMMSLPVDERHLSRLYELMSESVEEAENTFAEMSLTEGRSKAAANQISRVGADERGSILSTSYRQIDWMGDSNLQELLSESNFDLKDFLKGNMDVFVVLPEDQVHEHSRLVRMLMALLYGLIVRANPSELPQKKMLFLLDELAQLGYCPDVETFIEVLRARGIVVWSVFQDLSQMKLYQKPGLFKGAAIKQIFTNDDTDTMEWIQKLGAKKTVVTKTVSTNKGQSKQINQIFSNNKSSGEGESVHETGADLISINEIREMPIDEQWVFVSGQRPLRCKKIRYVDHPFFAGKFDANPLEPNSIKQQ